MKTKITQLFLTAILISSCNNRKEIEIKDSKECASKLFIEKQKTNKEFDLLTTSLDKKVDEICFKYFEFKPNLDTINGYWGVNNDTLYFFNFQQAEFLNPSLVPIIPLKAKIGLKYYYYDQKKIIEEIAFMGSLIYVEINDIAILNNDTIFKLTHTAVPLMLSYVPYEKGSKWVSPEVKKEFEISMRNGVLKYVQTFKGKSKEVEFYW